MEQQLRITIPLGKVDEEKRLVYGRAVQEMADKSGEILDYATAVPAFKKWSDDISTASGGLSKGNLRVMHDAKRVAGKVTDLHYNDDEKAIEVCAKVVDDAEWKKVLEGVYTGFSVGGSYARKWKDPTTGLTKYTPKVTELSLVDNPCIPSCRIVELQKADGSTATLELRGRPRSFDEVLGQATARSFDEVLAKGVMASAVELGRRGLRRLGVMAPEPKRAWAKPSVMQAWRKPAVREVLHPTAGRVLAGATGAVAGGVLASRLGLAPSRGDAGKAPGR